MVSNEEQVHLIQEGQGDLLLPLWKGNRGLAYSVARRYRSAAEANRATSMEDLMQAAFCGFYRAVETYEQGRGAAFSTVAVWHMHNELQALLGMRGRRRLDALCMSLDAPLGGDEDGITPIETLADPNVPDYAELAALDDTARTVREEVDKLDSPWREVLILHYYEGKSLEACARICFLDGYNGASRIHNRAILKLRRNRRLQRLIDMQCYDNLDPSPFYTHVGRKGPAGISAVELAAMRREHAEYVLQLGHCQRDAIHQRQTPSTS